MAHIDNDAHKNVFSFAWQGAIDHLSTPKVEFE